MTGEHMGSPISGRAGPSRHSGLEVQHWMFRRACFHADVGHARVRARRTWRLTAFSALSAAGTVAASGIGNFGAASAHGRSRGHREGGPGLEARRVTIADAPMGPIGLARLRVATPGVALHCEARRQPRRGAAVRCVELCSCRGSLIKTLRQQGCMIFEAWGGDAT